MPEISHRIILIQTMSSKVYESKLTLQNLQEQLQKWKQPYLKEANQTAKQFQEKVKEYRKSVIENVESPRTTDEIKKTVEQIDSERSQKMEKVRSPRAQFEQKSKTQPMQPKFQEWRHHPQYGFKGYDELVKNYDEVFNKKQKVKKLQEGEVIEDFRADEREMVQQIYEQLKNPKELTVSFEAIQEFFETYELFYYFYNIHPYRLANILKESARRFENKLTKQQFFDFFLVDRPTVSQFRTATQKDVCTNCILSEQNWKKLKNIFDTLDTFGNQKICIKTFYQRLRNNPSYISLLSSQAIEYPQIGRVYTLEKILFDLENKKSFQSKVGWETIQDQIFGFGHIQEPTLDVIYGRNIQMAKIGKDSNCFLLQPKVLKIIKEIFNRCPKYCNSFVKSSFFSYQLLEAGVLKPYFECATRLENSSKNTYLTLEQVIKKFSKEAPSYIDMDEMLQLLSAKGIQNSKKIIALYDEIETESDEEETPQRRQERKLKKIKSLEDLKRTLRKKSKKKPACQITKIKEFNLYKRDRPTIRQEKVQEMIREKQMEDEVELQKKFKANPIPVSLNPERYQKYAKRQQKKKESILNRLGIKREKDQIIIDYLKSNTKLFEEKKIKPHCDSPAQSYTFEPKPLPLHISQELLPKIEAEKEMRRKKIEEDTKKKYQEVYWKNLRETSSFQKDDSLLQKINLIEERKNFEQIKANEVPNFEQLHRKFQEELQKRKQTIKPTKIEQFNLSSPKRNNLNSQSPQPYKFKSKSPPKPQPEPNIKSTKKYEDWVAHNQAKAAQRELEELEKEREDQERVMKQRNFAKFMRKYLANCRDNRGVLRMKSQEKLRNFRMEVKRLEEETGEQLAQIYARVLQRPFLFEQAEKTRKPVSKERPKKINHPGSPQDQRESYPYKDGLFEKEGEEFHPIESQNLNQSF